MSLRTARITWFFFCVPLALLLFAQAAGAFGLSSVHLNVGGGWMGQSLEYEGIQFLDPDRKFWPAGGISVEFSLIEDSPIGLEVGALYFQKGFSTEIAEADSAGHIVGRFDLEPKAGYLSLPVLLRLQIPAGVVTAHVVAGASMEILLDDDDNEIFEQMDTANLAMHAGAGVEMGSVGLTVRYVRDVRNSYNTPPGATLEKVTNDGIIGLFTIALWRW